MRFKIKHWLENGFWIRIVFDKENIGLEMGLASEMCSNKNIELGLVLNYFFMKT